MRCDDYANENSKIIWWYNKKAYLIVGFLFLKKIAIENNRYPHYCSQQTVRTASIVLFFVLNVNYLIAKKISLINFTKGRQIRYPTMNQTAKTIKLATSEITPVSRSTDMVTWVPQKNWTPRRNVQTIQEMIA